MSSLYMIENQDRVGGAPQRARSYAASRLGFHYFPDTLHYRDSDLETWLPELQSLGAAWLTMLAPSNRAIPEPFIRSLLVAGIQPLLHFHLNIHNPPNLEEMRFLLETYSRWGVRYVILYDRPNLRENWQAAAWTQDNLVERFLDVYLPLAEAALQVGLIPVFPPLEPGGDYWDTAFLRAALQAIQRRGYHQLLDQLVLGAYAWVSNRPVTWGAGGPEHWPAARPYETPAGSEDQKGFYIFDWYLAFAETVLDKRPQIILVGAGCRPGDVANPGFPPVDLNWHAKTNLTLARLVCARSIESLPEGAQPIPIELLACNFWLLSTSPESLYARHAWFQPDGSLLPAVETLRHWISSWSYIPEKTPHTLSSRSTEKTHFIAHYLLLPRYEWGIADWHLQAMQPFVKKHFPTIGFSLEEASRAEKVTLLGGIQTFPEFVEERLAAAGCIVERINADGIEIAP